MAWYNTEGKNSETAVSTRIRFARNLADYPFASRLDQTSANEIIEKAGNILTPEKGYQKIDFSSVSPAKAQSYVEAHTVSPEFAVNNLPHALFINEQSDISVMVCEEDHLRMQCIRSGLALDDAFSALCTADDEICGSLNIAFDDKLGFLTHCPTNLGTAMRASVMLFLPALSMTKQISGISAQLAKLGLTLRGTYGEGSDEVGCLYQLSNQVTLGITEEDTIKKLSDVISQISERENSVRAAILSDNGDVLRDKIMRSYGALHYAVIMSGEEFMKHYTYVRLGISLGIINDMTYEELGDMMINVMPATLTVRENRSISEGERDRIRAEYIHKKINK